MLEELLIPLCADKATHSDFILQRVFQVGHSNRWLLTNRGTQTKKSIRSIWRNDRFKGIRKRLGLHHPGDIPALRPRSRRKSPRFSSLAPPKIVVKVTGPGALFARRRQSENSIQQTVVENGLQSRFYRPLSGRTASLSCVAARGSHEQKRCAGRLGHDANRSAAACRWVSEVRPPQIVVCGADWRAKVVVVGQRIIRRHRSCATARSPLGPRCHRR